MDKIRKVAFFCTGRAVMYGTLAIGCIMLTLAFDLALALHTGAIMTLAMAQILIVKALMVPWQNPRRTEVWLYLEADARPAGDPARLVFACILRDVYARYAHYAFIVACWLFAGAMVLKLLRAA